mgnify:CR=1 FL=1
MRRKSPASPKGAMPGRPDHCPGTGRPWLPARANPVGDHRHVAGVHPELRRAPVHHSDHFPQVQRRLPCRCSGRQDAAHRTAPQQVLSAGDDAFTLFHQLTDTTRLTFRSATTLANFSRGVSLHASRYQKALLLDANVLRLRRSAALLSQGVRI